MEKISGIVPATSRVRSVNLKDGQPVRPGAPAFGRPVGRSALADQKAESTAERALAEHKQLMDQRSGKKPGPEIITDMADQFFMQRSTGPAGEIEDIDLNYNMDRPAMRDVSHTSVDRLEPSSLPSLDSSVSEMEADRRMENQDSDFQIEDDDYTPPGTYLDVNA